MRALFLVILAALPASALQVWSDDLPAALARAKAKGTLVFVDLGGKGCPSCDAMDANVLNTPRMMKLRDRFELVKLDSGSPAGEEFVKARRLFGIPVYMLLDADGAELGISRGESPAGEFFKWIDESAAKRKTLPQSEALARAGGAAGVAAARDVLAAYALRNQDDEGLAFFKTLPADVRGAVEEDPAGGVSLAMLRLYAARDAKEGAACLGPARRLVGLHKGAIDPYELFVVLACSSYQPAEGQMRLKEFLEEPVKRLLKEQVDIPKAKRRTDFEDAVQWAAQYYRVTGRREKAAAIDAKAKG